MFYIGVKFSLDFVNLEEGNKVITIGELSPQDFRYIVEIRSEELQSLCQDSDKPKLKELQQKYNISIPITNHVYTELLKDGDILYVARKIKSKFQFLKINFVK